MTIMSLLGHAGRHCMFTRSVESHSVGNMHLQHRHCVAQLPAVVIVGVVDGVSHVNLSLIRKILAWWVLGALLVFLIPAFLTWQGIAIM